MISPVLLTTPAIACTVGWYNRATAKAGRRVDCCRDSVEKVRQEAFLFFFWTRKLLDMLIKGYGRVREIKKSRMTARFSGLSNGEFTKLKKIGESRLGVGRKGLSLMLGEWETSGSCLSCHVVSFPHAPSLAEMVKS